MIGLWLGGTFRAWRGGMVATLALGLALGPAVAASAGGRQLWVQRYDAPGDGTDQALSLAASPDGSKVFVTGYTQGPGGGDDYGTVAYDAATGTQLWGERYDGPAGGDDIARAVAVSPDGSKVFVTGESPGADVYNEDFTTIAYDAATGGQLWVDRYNGSGNGQDGGYSIAVTPNGSRVLATGFSTGLATIQDYTTLAYDAATGSELWVSSFNGHSDASDVANALAVSPDGSRAFVTGSVAWPGSGSDYGTVAYDTATGAQLWAQRYNGPGNDFDDAFSVAVTPGGTKVFVTGWSAGEGTSGDYATLAYDASSGSQLWLERYNGPGNGDDVAASIAVSPGGSKVFVTGQSAGVVGWDDYATVAYDAGTGSRIWLSRYDSPWHNSDYATSVAVAPGGTKVFVSGTSRGDPGGWDYATVAYSAGGGVKLWNRRYDGPGHWYDAANRLAVSPDGSMVFVTGASTGVEGDTDYATVAYTA